MDAETILQYCLEEIEAGRLTASECVARFPAMAELEEQLLAAEALRQWTAPTLSQAGDEAIRARLRARAGQLRAASRAARTATRPKRPAPQLRWAFALGAVVALFALTAGTVSASGASLPGDWLYPVKRTTESVRLYLASPAQQAGLHAEFARERADELLAVAQRGSVPLAAVEAAVSDTTAEMQAALDAVSQVPAEHQVALLETMLATLDYQAAVLAEAQATLPPQAQDELDRSLQASEAQRERAQALLVEANDGSQTPPGQTHVPPGQTRVPPGLTNIPPSQTRVIPGQTRQPPGQTRVPPGQTNVPPGQERKTASPAPGDVLPTTVSATETRVPPGQARKTESPTPEPTRTPRPDPGGGNPTNQPGGPNCQAGNPNSPNYCTPTPGQEGGSPPLPTTSAPIEPTACPTNPGGQPKCGR
jgi:hypothetical protein